MIQRAFRSGHIDIDCVDSFGRGAINLAIENENLEMLEMLVVMGVGPKDNLLHAINAEFVEAVELLLQYEELVHTEGEPYVSEMSTHIGRYIEKLILMKIKFKLTNCYYWR